MSAFGMVVSVMLGTLCSVEQIPHSVAGNRVARLLCLLLPG